MRAGGKGQISWKEEPKIKKKSENIEGNFQEKKQSDRICCSTHYVHELCVKI